MNADDPLQRAIGEWQHKYRIADGDPIIAVFELVRLQLQHAHTHRDDAADASPTFEDFRSTIELLDRRSKAFVHQATDLQAELRRFALGTRRINGARVFTHIVLLIVGAVIGAIATRVLW